MTNHGLVPALTFGNQVLLQPELLDAYASAMVDTAKVEPDGLGSLAEEVALAGEFFAPKEQKVTDPGQEQLLLHATVEELVRHDLALRENADDGRYLVLPSQFNRDYEDAPEPKGKAVAITFDGPVQSLYLGKAVAADVSRRKSLGFGLEECADSRRRLREGRVFNHALREKGTMEFNCPCGGTVPLAEPKERIHFESKAEAMDKSADRQRDFDAFVLSAKGETRTKSFQEWAGGEWVALAIVFTDVAGSTAELGENPGAEARAGPWIR